MDLSQYTEQVKDVVQGAHIQAIGRQHQDISLIHILYSLLIHPKSDLADVFRSLKIDHNSIIKQIEDSMDRIPKVSGSGYDPHKIYFSKMALQFLAQTSVNRKKQGKPPVSEIDLFLELAKFPEPVLQNIFKLIHLDKRKLTDYIKTRSQSSQIPETDTVSQTIEKMNKFGRNLVACARDGKLDPVIGRDEEIRRVIRILSRKTKNNPVLIGEPGVGKTAIAEGLAQRIVNGDVPDVLKDRVIFALDIAALVAGAKYRGEFEERIKMILKQIKQSDGQIILFIDELHNLIGAGKTDGSLDASNMLKPMLARGELHCIGATTLDEHKIYIEKDPALERRFQPVLVKQANVADTISILRGLRERFEVHHGVKIHDQAIIAAATLSNRYINDRFLPDKAIDLIDEASAKIKTEIDSQPSDLDQIQRKKMRLEIEEAALKKESDPQSKRHLKELQVDLENIKNQQNLLENQYMKEKKKLQELRTLRKKLEEAKQELSIAERNYELERAAELRHGKIPNMLKQITEKENLYTADKPQVKILKEEVDEEEIAEIVHQWTGIPVAKLITGEKEKLLKLNKDLKMKVIGQDEGVDLLTDAILRARTGIHDPKRPIGSFLFLGPTGVGKTQLAKSLTQLLFDHEERLVRIDLSEYMEKHSVSRLIGAPPGYIGHEAGGQLTETIRKQPYSVILFDEIEKAHPDIFHVLLQLLDDGRLTDSQGRVVDFKNCVIILTSNIGSDLILQTLNCDGKIEKPIQEEVYQKLYQFFKPEFLNRIDEILMFKPLGISQVKEICRIILGDLEQRLDTQGVRMRLSDPAIEFLAEQGYDAKLGARPLKRFVQKQVETPLAKILLKAEQIEGTNIVIDRGEKGLAWDVSQGT